MQNTKLSSTFIEPNIIPCIQGPQTSINMNLKQTMETTCERNINFKPNSEKLGPLKNVNSLGFMKIEEVQHKT